MCTKLGADLLIIGIGRYRSAPALLCPPTAASAAAGSNCSYLGAMGLLAGGKFSLAGDSRFSLAGVSRRSSVSLVGVSRGAVLG